MMHRRVLILIACVIFTIKKEVCAKLIRIPENTAVRIGNEVILKCQTDPETKLQWLSTGDSGIEIFNGNKLNPAAIGYEVNRNSSGQFDLIFNATKQSAMLYTCQEVKYNGEKMSAEVIVIESSLNCRSQSSTASSPDSKSFTACDVQYSGNWRPNLYWKLDGKMAVFPVNSSFKGEEKIILPQSSAFKTEGHHTVECFMRFFIDNYTGEATAQDVPCYTDTCVVPTDAPDLCCPERDHCRISLHVFIFVFLLIFALENGVLLYLYLKKKLIFVCLKRYGSKEFQMNEHGKIEESGKHLAS